MKLSFTCYICSIKSYQDYSSKAIRILILSGTSYKQKHSKLPVQVYNIICDRYHYNYIAKTISSPKYVIRTQTGKSCTVFMIFFSFLCHVFSCSDLLSNFVWLICKCRFEVLRKSIRRESVNLVIEQSSRNKFMNLQSIRFLHVTSLGYSNKIESGKLSKVCLKTRIYHVFNWNKC